VRRVVISGLGMVAPTGVGAEIFWRALLEGRCAIDRITRFDPTSYPCQVGGEVRDTSYEALLDPRMLRTTAHATQLAVAAAELALRDARLDARSCEPDLLGVVLGTALGGWRDAAQQQGILLERGARRVNPFVVSGTPNHAPAAEVASAFGAQGTQLTFSAGCPASLQAIHHGATLIAGGELDVCLAGGTESPLIPMVLAAMGRTQELSVLNDEPARASRPFDCRHAGIVLSEGGCVVVLESAESAARRGVLPYAEVLGGASSCDARGIYGYDPSGEPGARAVRRALSRSGIGSEDIDYLCAHANASPIFDRKEALVIHSAFGEVARRIAVSSIKGITGHPFGASGAFQVAATALAIRNQLIPPTHNLDSPAPECDLNHVTGAPRAGSIRHALITSYGYGGVNSYLVIGAADRPELT
jgi:3-oxoacyl-[acyl-carrier-protein] synthase II